jgi:ABC-type hemin transport system ATPase subunit
MVEDLKSWIWREVDTDPALSTVQGLLVLAAMESDQDLERAVNGESGSEVRANAESTVPASIAPEGVWLSSLSVQGFRGIGDRVTVTFAPGPGLTIVCGRNGSGKSSLAEALETVLTGSTYRWKNKSSQWKEQWRNLHSEGEPVIEVGLTSAGAGPTTIGAKWPTPAGDVSEVVHWHQHAGDKRRQGLDGLGWKAALETYRPLMSYDELGGILETGPSALYDALSRALGVEAISEAIARLNAQSKRLKQPGDAVTTQRRAMASELASIPDERAELALAQIKKREIDTSALRALATGQTAPDLGVLGDLRRIEAVEVPTADRVSSASATLRSAVEAMSKAGEAESARNLARLELRRQALAIHDEFGEMPCPVCAAATLDENWASTTAADVRRRTAELQTLERCRDDLLRARDAARRLVTSHPRPLDKSPMEGLTQTTMHAREAWDAWASLPPSDLDLADHMVTAHAAVVTALDSLKSDVAVELQARQDAWTPVAGRLVHLCDAMDEWDRTKELSTDVAAALQWMKANDIRLKNERLTPIGDAARAAWALLRQESNVDLGALTLEGTATRRRVNIGALVDGESAGALSIMSQGELHALSLALFLPRASMDVSPFRFVVLDDPVQAMDPAKVDGLVALLSKLAVTRQVIVLSHDDRLPAAARRARVGARIVEVTRGELSSVTLTDVEDPASRYLKDAFALVSDEELPDETLRRTLPGLLRMAVESAAREAFFGRRLLSGQCLASVEGEWSVHRRTADRVSLAVFDEKRDLAAWLDRGFRRGQALGVVTSAAHTGLSPSTDPRDACRSVESLVDDIRTGKRS